MLPRMDKGMRRKALAGLAMCLSLAYLGHVAWARLRLPPFVPVVPESVLAARLHIHIPADVARLRGMALREIFGGALPASRAHATPTAPPFPSVAWAEALPNDSYYLVNRRPNGKLAIYHAGHSQHVLTDAADTVQAMLDAGYDVLAMSMLPEPHARYHGLRPFLQPMAEALNYATHRKHYRDIVMVGLSGGGWTTVVYSALDPRITRSVPVAGSLPLPLRTDAGAEHGDYEQRLPGLSLSYLDLYVLASSEGREQVQVFNLHDPCCFAGTRGQAYEKLVGERSQQLGGRFGVVIVENRMHSFAAALTMLVFPDQKLGNAEDGGVNEVPPG